ncbi:nuclear transport factor 2 family protein [Maribacter sp. PR1]|uniref:Nuclear transport factor 2 family protein n=1 Tax=Maribacter cobaltidurans TaxID=1178778 RepID=A0ABU7IUS1_9FLAO|nr:MULTISPECIES: nuclear transport factor 2 family protein [Maribacter]MDC6389346.1 nuclear transport factor 2 family protein [Maribacter sp. PR1]MEE1976734.1 nuclear transport factor 2 family protein [Maribacter cobaltidurans]
MTLLKIIVFAIVAFFTSLTFGQVSKDSELYKTILELDKTYFTAYNECDMETQEAFYDEDLEFYHDKGGLATDKVALLESIKKNICGKVTRSLVEESLEVHAIPGFGAVQIGLHSFFNKEEPNAESKPSKFIAIWKNTDNNWQMHRVISLH